MMISSWVNNERVSCRRLDSLSLIRRLGRWVSQKNTLAMINRGDQRISEREAVKGDWPRFHDLVVSSFSSLGSR